MTSATKRIPVTKKVWETLHGMRKPGQTYDELIGELIRECKDRVGVGVKND